MIGKVVSHYKVLEKIGQGGMGEIWLAEDTKLGRKVALKFLSEKFTLKESARERFNREARAAAALNHPGIVTVYEIDEFEGLIYIAMEYVEGETLAEKMRFAETEMDGKTIPLKILQTLPINDVIEIMLEVSRGLQKAHGAGIVHRDIKLENIMIGRDGRVKILDFGLARLKGVSRLTEDSVTMGTAYYMSPEQVQGEEFDHRTDIWSLGVVMYLMTTGRFPFDGKTTLDTMFAITGKEPEPIRRLNKSVPAGLERIVKGCLKKRADDRYQDMTDLIADLEKIRDSLISGKSAHIPRPPRGKSIFRKRFFKIAASLLLAAALTLSLLLSPAANLKVRKLLGFEIVPEKKYLALLPFAPEKKQSATERLFCAGLTHCLRRKLIRFEQFEKDLLVIPTRKLRKISIVDIEGARLAFGVNLVIGVGVTREDDNIRLSLKLTDAKKRQTLDRLDIDSHVSEICDLQEKVIDQVFRMMEMALKPGMKELLTLGSTSVPGAYDRYLRAWGYLWNPDQSENIDAAIKLFRLAVEIDTDFALAYAGLAESYLQKYRHTKDDRWADEGIVCCNRAVEINDRLACVHITMGKIYRDRGQYPRSTQAFRKALLGDPLDAEAYYYIAKNFEDQENFPEAEKGYREACLMRPRDFSVYNNLGNFYYNQGIWHKAIKAYKDMLEVNPDYLTGVTNLGSLYFSLDRRAEAREMFERSLSIKPTPETYSNLGTLYFHDGLFDLAVERFKKALEMQDSDYRVWGYLAETYYWTKKERDRMRPNYRKAVELAVKAFAKNPDDAEVISNLAFYHLRLGNLLKTRDLLEKFEKVKHPDPGAITIINTYEQMGEREEALRWLKFALGKGIPMTEIKHNPGLYELRSDSRYQELLKGVEESEKSKDGKSNLKKE